MRTASSNDPFTPVEPTVPLHGVARRAIGNRYQVIGPLEPEGRGDDLLAVDGVTGQTVVVRWLSPPGDGSLSVRVEHEAEILQKLDNPLVGRILTIGRDGGRHYFVRKFVPGITLRQRLRNGALNLEDTLTVGRGLLAALDEAHRAGLLHRDVRPSNIIVHDTVPLAGVVLTDFALGNGADHGTVASEKAIEVALYHSPESAGTIDCNVGVISDLYSAGIVLFECLAGSPPFHGNTVGTVLMEHMTVRVPELRSLGLDVPRALDELILRLLRKDPRDRYQTARAVLMDLESIARSRRDRVEETDVVVGSHDRRPTLAEPAFVGRQRELAEIQSLVREVQNGRSQLAVVEAESGGGKTRFLGEIAMQGARAGMWVLRGHASEQVGQQPFQLLQGIVNHVLAAARRDPVLACSLHDRLGEHAEGIGSLFPELAHSLGWPIPSSLGPESFAEARSIQILTALVGALSSRDRPAMIILDDCQWADEMTVRLLAHWHATQGASDSRDGATAVVLAYRSEEVGAEHPLRRIRARRQICLAPLVGDETQRLLESMAGPLPKEAVAAVVRLSEGSPFMASAILRGMVESGALVSGPQGWCLEPLALADLQSSSRAAGFLSQRIELLPAATIELLTAGAVVGKEFDVSLATRLVARDLAEAAEILEPARTRHLVWTRAEGAECVFVHDKIRAALLTRLTPELRRELHRRIADHLANEASDRVFDLAYHFDAAGENARAMPFALAAAEQARAQHSLEIAEQQYRIARRGEGSADRGTSYRIREGLGDVLMLRGRYDEAKEMFHRAAEVADGDHALAQIKGKLGELDFKRGDMQSAASAIEEALRVLGHSYPLSLPLAILVLAWQAGVQLLHSAFPTLLVSRRKDALSDLERLRLRLHSRLLYAYWFTRGKIQTFAVHLRCMNYAERYPASAELAQIYSEHAMGMTVLGLFDRGLTYVQRSLAIRQALGDLWGQGQSLSFYGCVLYAASRFHEALDKCREAVRLLERTGDYWEVHIARYQVAASLYRLGKLHAAVEEARRIHESGLALGEQQASGISLDIWAMATGGRVPAEVLQAELARERPDAQGKAQVFLAEGVQLLAAGRCEAAAMALERAIEEGARLGLSNAYTAPNWAWLTTALRRQAEMCADLTPEKRRSLLARAERSVATALRVGRRFQNDAPHALRECALIWAMRGRPVRARRLLDKSLAIAARQQARYEYAQTLLARARIGRELCWPEADRQFQEAEAILDELMRGAEAALDEDDAPPVTLSLADRFDAVLESGHKIASALSAEAICEEARAAAVRLLRAEQCLVLRIDSVRDVSEPTPLAGEAAGRCHKEIVRSALAAGRARAFVEESMGGGADSAVAAGERSALVAPIYVRGRATACLYATHEQIRGLFGPDEERLANFIATIAGAAMENAEGFLRLQRWNEELESRVAERTAAAESRAAELAKSNSQLERIAQILRRKEEELHVAKQAAEAASEAKSRFLATMSHEIRTPMNGILGMTELALSTGLPDPHRKHLLIVKQSANALLTLLNDILDFSKIEAGRMELERIAFDVRDLVGDAARLLAVSASEKQLELVCRIRPEVPVELAGDPGRLRQILVNLLGNAIKFTSEGEIVVDVRLESLEHDQATLEFSVSDTGIGIPPDKQCLIFDAFRQSDSSTTRRFGGTGLGLAISSQLVTLMGGRMCVESEPGRGSTFRFVASFGVGDSAGQPTGPRCDECGTVAWLYSRNGNACMAYRETLAGAGIDAATSESADETIQTVRRRQTDGRKLGFAVIDVGCGADEDMDLVRTLRRSEPDFPLIVLLAAGKLDLAEECRQLGAQCLSKPAKASELLEAACVVSDQESLTSIAAPDAVIPCTRRLTVLLAEDGVVNQEVAVGLLELSGHTVVVAGDGREAIDAFARQEFDVILMDVEMPEIDGLTATAEIRKIEAVRGGHTPIIAMTAHAKVGFGQRCLAAGMDDYISKPIHPQELSQAIVSALGG